MVFGLDKQSYNQTLNIKTEFENDVICDVSITLITSCVGDFVEESRKQCIGCLHFFKYKISSIQSIFVKFRTMYLDDCAIIPNIQLSEICFYDGKLTILRQKFGSSSN